jgi:hypothetical protein
VAELMSALNNYYYVHCARNKDEFKNLNITTLLQWQKDNNLKVISNIDNNGNIDNNLGRCSVSIIDKTNSNSSQSFYILHVQLTLSDITRADYIRGALNADAAGRNTAVVTWTRIPVYGMDDISSRQWIMNQGTAQEFMPGRAITAVNTGLASKFWVLNSQSQAYAREQAKRNEKVFPDTVCPN